MAVDRNCHADRRDAQHPGEEEFIGEVGADTGDLEQLNAGEGSDHRVDGKPSDPQEKGEKRTRVGSATAKDPLREDDLRLATARPCVAQQAEEDGAGDRPQKYRDQPVPNTETVVSGEQARGEQAGGVDERPGPYKAELAGSAVALSLRDGVDPARLDL